MALRIDQGEKTVPHEKHTDDIEDELFHKKRLRRRQ
jgi:hypothetical protein